MAIVFNVQRFSVQDGPGVRTTVFIKGCPLRCLWCSNPESQNAVPEVAHRPSLCQKCGHCSDICDKGAIALGQKGISIDRDKCNNCGKCARECPNGAIKIYGEEMSVDEIYKVVIRDKQFYENSDGGITVSGGEALTQSTFVSELFKKCKDAAIHTCLDTTGFAQPERVYELLKYTDLVLYDLKLLDSDEHKRMTGVSNQLILQNLPLIVKSGVKVIVRIPLIPGINDSIDNIIDTINFVKKIDGINDINLLQYHRLGISKYSMLDKHYSLPDLVPQTKDYLEKLCSIVKSFNFDCDVIS
jgi:pyruvate formate lyase activating enzyme